MKTSKTLFKRKAFAFFGAAAVLLAAVFIAGCKTDVGDAALLPMYSVKFGAEGGHGTLKAKADGVSETETSPVTVEKGKTVTFTATPESGYEVDKWTVTGGELKEGGIEGSTTAKVKITGNVTASVSFKKNAVTPPSTVYTKVSLSQLDDYLKNTASSTDVNYIEVQGLTAADLKGDSSHYEASPLGKILNDSSDKKVVLKFGGNIEGLTDMSRCFLYCTSLTQTPVIPAGVTDMALCFTFCTKLESAVLKCNYNPAQIDRRPAFIMAFAACESLPAGGIKVPADQLDAYKAGAGVMSMSADRFAAE